MVVWWYARLCVRGDIFYAPYPFSYLFSHFLSAVPWSFCALLLLALLLPVK